MRPSLRSLSLLLAFLTGVLVSGCMRSPAALSTTDPGRLSTAARGLILPARFVEAPRQAARSAFGTRSWWRTLRDRDLDALVAIALRDNFTLREAGARVTAAQAALRQASARLFPTVDGTGGLSDRWSSEGGGGDPEATLGALLAWEADVFGRLRAAHRASARELSATRADLAGTRLLLSSTVAETYFARAEQQQQLALLAEQIKVGETLLRLTRLRFGQGQASIVDVLQQEQQLKETRALVPIVEARVVELGYVLDALLGRPPRGAPRPRPARLPGPPSLPATGLPSDLLLRRPDLVAAQERIAALDARVTVALAEKLPRFQLSASTVATAGNPSSLVASLISSVVAPLFDAGARQAEVTRSRAELEGAVAAYANRFLGALRDVESALVNERQQGERLRRQELQLETAKRLLRETRNRYSQGLTEYLPVLAALTTVQQLERDILSTRRDLLSQRIALHRALGGPVN